MREWVSHAFNSGQELGSAVIAARLLATLVLGTLVAGLYRAANGRSTAQSLSMMATLVMLAVLIAMLTMVIGDSQARAFSLVGALAIIRFRTVVEDTRDTAFVIFAVAVGMAAGTGYLTVIGMGMPFAAVAAMAFRPRGAKVEPMTADHQLIVRIGVGRDPESVLCEPLGKHFSMATLISITTARQGAALELTYAVRLRQPETAAAIVAGLNVIDGVQGIELRRA